MTTERTAGVGETTHRAARNASIRGVAEILGKVATLAWTVAAAHVLTQEDFGAVSFAIALMYLLSSFAEWGYDVAVVRRGSVDHTVLPRVYLSAQVWKTAVGVVVFVGAALVTLGTRPSMATWVVLVVMLLAGFPELWSHTARAVASARQEPAGISVALVTQRIVTAVAIVLALAAGLGPIGLAVGFGVGTFAGWFAHHVAVRRLGVSARLRDLTRVDLRTAASGTLLVGFSGLVLMMLFRVDMVLLAELSGDREVAVYSVAYRLLETVLFVSYAIHQAILPVMSAATSRERHRSAYEGAMGAVGFVYLPFAVVCVLDGTAVIELLFPSGYAAGSGQALAWLAPAPLLFAVALLGTAHLLALDRNRAMLLAASVALAVNLVLNALLIPSHGATGAAAATSAAYAVQALVVLLVLRRSMPRPRILTALLPACAASLPLGAVLWVLHVPLVLELALGAAVYLGTWVLTAHRAAPYQLAVARRLLSRRVAR